MTQISKTTHVDLSFVGAVEGNEKKTILYISGQLFEWDVPLQTALQFIEINKRSSSVIATP